MLPPVHFCLLFACLPLCLADNAPFICRHATSLRSCIVPTLTYITLSLTATVCTHMLLPITSKSVAMVAMVGINQVSDSFVSSLPACSPLLPLRFPWVLQVSSLHLLSTFIDKTTLVAYVVLHSSRFGAEGSSLDYLLPFPHPDLTTVFTTLSPCSD